MRSPLLISLMMKLMLLSLTSIVFVGCAKITFDGGTICAPIGDFAIPGRTNIGLPPLSQTNQLPSELRTLPTITQSFDVSETFAALQTIANNSSARVNHLIIMPLPTGNLNSLGFIEQLSAGISADATSNLPALPSSNLVIFRRSSAVAEQQSQPIHVLPTELQSTIAPSSLILAGNAQTDIAPFFAHGMINIIVNSQVNINHADAPNNVWGIRCIVCVRPVSISAP